MKMDPHVLQCFKTFMAIADTDHDRPLLDANTSDLSKGYTVFPKPNNGRKTS
jgi:hypothetical protein